MIGNQQAKLTVTGLPCSKKSRSLTTREGLSPVGGVAGNPHLSTDVARVLEPWRGTLRPRRSRTEAGGAGSGVTSASVS